MDAAFSANAPRLARDAAYREAVLASFGRVELAGLGWRDGPERLHRGLADLAGRASLSVHLPHDYRWAGPSHRRRALAGSLRWLDGSARLGAERAVVHAAHTPPGRVARALCAPRRSRSRRAVPSPHDVLGSRALAKLARRAEDVGVRLFVENVDPGPRPWGRAPARCSDPNEVAALAEGLGLEPCLDIAHAARGGFGPGSPPLAAHVHVSGVDPSGRAHVGLDRNARVDLAALDRCLRASGAGAWAVLETRSLGSAMRSRAIMGW